MCVAGPYWTVTHRDTGTYSQTYRDRYKHTHIGAMTLKKLQNLTRPSGNRN